MTLTAVETDVNTKQLNWFLTSSLSPTQVISYSVVPYILFKRKSFRLQNRRCKILIINRDGLVLVNIFSGSYILGRRVSKTVGESQIYMYIYIFLCVHHTCENTFLLKFSKETERLITMKNLWNQYYHDIKYVDNTDPALEGFIIEWVNLCYISSIWPIYIKRDLYHRKTFLRRDSFYGRIFGQCMWESYYRNFGLYILLVYSRKHVFR